MTERRANQQETITLIDMAISAAKELTILLDLIDKCRVKETSILLIDNQMSYRHEKLIQLNSTRRS